MGRIYHLFVKLRFLEDLLSESILPYLVDDDGEEGGRRGADDEQDHDGDQHDHEHPLLGVVQPPPLGRRPLSVGNSTGLKNLPPKKQTKMNILVIKLILFSKLFDKWVKFP